MENKNFVCFFLADFQESIKHDSYFVYYKWIGVKFKTTECSRERCFVFREVFMEKHWKTVVNKSICDYFFEAQKKVRRHLSEEKN